MSAFERFARLGDRMFDRMRDRAMDCARGGQSLASQGGVSPVHTIAEAVWLA